MPTRRTDVSAILGSLTVGLFFAAGTSAGAETTDLQACATQYQAAKADNKLNGQAWQDFFTDCKARLSAAAPAKAEAPEAKEAAPPPKESAAKPEPAATTAPTPTPPVAETPPHEKASEGSAATKDASHKKAAPHGKRKHHS